jgi:hypothetical protein
MHLMIEPVTRRKVETARCETCSWATETGTLDHVGRLHLADHPTHTVVATATTHATFLWSMTNPAAPAAARELAEMTR